ncbi:MAG: 2-aminoethylphosphonate--pyruvate transaminase [Myxococcales bacterium]|nr:2-aminoethylphosphonate--pyruvate transaminase [Myxococcales bacterium]
MADPLLLTPGPLTTAAATRAAMTRDYGSRDPAFVAITQRVCQQLVALAGGDAGFACVPMQGSGTFAIEGAVGTLVPRDGKLLVCVNGAYGERMAEIARTIGRACTTLEFDETEPVDPARLDAALRADPQISHVGVIYCETTAGVLNPIEAIGAVVARHGRRLLLDAMSAFGALPLDVMTLPVDAVMASSNKCLEGVPGLGFVLAPVAALVAAKGNAHSLALDLCAQHLRLARDGQWRFTPPTHVIAALDAAIAAHAAEGGVDGRGARYRANCKRLVDGMRALGFGTLLPDAVQAPIIVTFAEPEDPRFVFETFYDALNTRGFAIYPGKLTRAATFRVGCIGQVFAADIDRFLSAVREALAELGLPTPLPAMEMTR